MAKAPKKPESPEPRQFCEDHIRVRMFHLAALADDAEEKGLTFAEISYRAGVQALANLIDYPAPHFLEDPKQEEALIKKAYHIAQ